jgi:hypothetical protein
LGFGLAAQIGVVVLEFLALRTGIGAEVPIVARAARFVPIL